MPKKKTIESSAIATTMETQKEFTADHQDAMGNYVKPLDLAEETTPQETAPPTTTPEEPEKDYPRAEMPEWISIADAAAKEINVQGAIRKVKGKAPIFTDKDHNVLLWSDSGKKMETFNSTGLVKQLFGIAIPATGDERENSSRKTTKEKSTTIKPNNTMATAKKPTDKKATSEKKVTSSKTTDKATTKKAAIEKLKSNPKVTSIMKDKETSQSDKIRAVAKFEEDRATLAEFFGVIYQTVRGALLPKKEKK